MSIFSGLEQYYGYCSGLRRFLKRRISLQESREIVSRRLEKRSDMFLDFMKTRVYGNENSPYLKIIKTTGREYSDIESMVSDSGVEGTLEKLAGEGVYLTVDEFKGRSDCVRNNHTFRFKESDFDNTTNSGFSSRSGGTRSSGTHVFIDFNRIEEGVPNSAVLLDVHGLLDKPCVVWFPAGLGLWVVLSNAKLGNPPLRWFSQVDWTFQTTEKPFSRVIDGMMEISTVIIGRTRGIRLPRPEHIPFEETWRIVEYMSELAKKYSGFTVRTYPSSALRASKIAVERGLDIEGACFMVGGEAITKAKKREIESSGAKVIPYYASMEAGVISYGCGNPRQPDDTHLLTDALAMIQHSREVANFGIKVKSLLLTSLLPNASKLLLNVEMGDTGILEERSCGCGWEGTGFSKHLHSIRSFEKLTGEGMTILNSDLIQIVEGVLPEKFGGSTMDYQILEEEDERGFTGISILISPDVGEVSEDEVLETILQELKTKGIDSGSSSLSADVWEQAKTMKIKRAYPKRTPTGKIFSFQVDSRRR